MRTPNQIVKDCDLSRREFLRNSLIVVGAAPLSGVSLVRTNIVPDPVTRVVVVRDPGALDSDLNPRPNRVEEMLSQGILALSGESSLEKAWNCYFPPDSRIAIKSNVSVQPTHPDVHAAILRSLSRYGCLSEDVRMWDRNRGGIGLAKVNSRDWDWTPGYEKDCLSRAVHWADALINAPVLKTHSLTAISGAVKNWVGAVTRINRRDHDTAFDLHANRGAGMACINALPPIRGKCRFIVTDALTPFYQESPVSTTYRSWPFGGLILGTDPVAVDRIGWEILRDYLQSAGLLSDGLVEPPIHLCEASKKYQLGEWDRERIDLRAIGGLTTII